MRAKVVKVIYIYILIEKIAMSLIPLKFFARFNQLSQLAGVTFYYNLQFPFRQPFHAFIIFNRSVVLYCYFRDFIVFLNTVLYNRLKIRKQN